MKYDNVNNLFAHMWLLHMMLHPRWQCTILNCTYMIFFRKRNG